MAACLRVQYCKLLEACEQPADAKTELHSMITQLRPQTDAMSPDEFVDHLGEDEVRFQLMISVQRHNTTEHIFELESLLQSWLSNQADLKSLDRPRWI